MRRLYHNDIQRRTLERLPVHTNTWLGGNFDRGSKAQRCGSTPYICWVFGPKRPASFSLLCEPHEYPSSVGLPFTGIIVWRKPLSKANLPTKGWLSTALLDKPEFCKAVCKDFIERPGCKRS